MVSKTEAIIGSSLVAGVSIVAYAIGMTVEQTYELHSVFKYVIGASITAGYTYYSMPVED